MRKLFCIGAVAATIALIPAAALAADCEACAAPRDEPGFDGDGGTWNPQAPAGLTLLQFDDGSYETGLGVTGAAGYDGQIAMRFGSGAATTGAVPHAIRGAYWRQYPGFGGATNININFFHPLTANGFPTGPPVYVVPGNTSTVGTQFASAPNGPTISTANGSVLVGVGVSGNNSWFVAGDTNPPTANRHFFGAFTTQDISYGPSTLNGYGFVEDFLIRFLIDGQIPVELQTFDVE
ncbi:MAG: hypothetical protein ACRD0X_04475 [Thermoanaerobaculia bacterium]